MFLRNSWYVIAWSHEVGDRPFGRTVLNEPIVIYRNSEKRVVALHDRCPHRFLPLSMGKVVGDRLQCGYHGLQFDETGKCVHVPLQDTVPDKACVKTYPAEERYGWIWVWMGDADKADPELIPDFHWLVHPDYKAVGKTNHVKADYRLVIDNLMDLSHVAFVHTTTIGNSPVGEKVTFNIHKTDQGVQMVRLVSDVPPPPTYVKSGTLPEGKNIDRWQIIDFVSPCFVMIHVGGAEAGTGALEGRYEHGLNIWVLNAMTPETETSTNYFWASVRCHALDDPKVDELFFKDTSEAFSQDQQVLEAQQKSIPNAEEPFLIALRADAGCFQARRVLGKHIEREQQAT